MPIDYLKNVTDCVEFKAGEKIFDAATPGHIMYAVREGEVNIMLEGQLLEVCGPGHYFGEMALIDKKLRAAEAIASTNCKLVEVNKDRFIFLVQETPTFALQIMHEMAERIRRATPNLVMEDLEAERA